MWRAVQGWVKWVILQLKGMSHRKRTEKMEKKSKEDEKGTVKVVRILKKR
jgi:hypothetical protein